MRQTINPGNRFIFFNNPSGPIRIIGSRFNFQQPADERIETYIGKRQVWLFLLKEGPGCIKIACMVGSKLSYPCAPLTKVLPLSRNWIIHPTSGNTIKFPMRALNIMITGGTSSFFPPVMFRNLFPEFRKLYPVYRVFGYKER